MSIHIKLSTTLRQYVPDYDPLAGIDMEPDFSEKINPGLLADKLGLPRQEIKFIMINGKHQPLDTPLAQGDRLAYFPAVGGG